MKWLRLVLFCCTSGLFLAACATPEESISDEVTAGDGFELSPDQIDSLQALAEDGDVSATKRLIAHYQLFDSNIERTVYWQRVAYSQGDAIAALNLATSRSSSGTSAGCREAKAILSGVDAMTGDVAIRQKAATRLADIELGKYPPCVGK